MLIQFPIVLVGLGNPELTYSRTRHNIGRELLFALAENYNISFERFKKSGYVAWLKHDQGQTALFYPEGYMNNSGSAVGEFLHYYRISPHKLCVLHDEIEKKVGVCRLKLGGSARGHNGLKDIIRVLGDSFWRLGIGVDHPKKLGLQHSVSDYVLSVPDAEDAVILSESIKKVVHLSDALLMGGFEEVKNILNKS